jgi:DNA-binding NarL/FixJ family response regulator
MSTGTIRMLIVDDHPLMREGLRGRLSRVPRIEIVGEAECAAQALELLTQVSVDLLLTDIGMKGVNGIELAREVARRHPDVAVLILSMYDDVEYVQQALQAGARGYVLKDSPSAHLVSAIESVVGGGTYLSPAITNCLFAPKAVECTLTSRELEILHGLANGQSSKHIARTLSISVRTVESHRQSIKRKVNVDGQAELIKYAIERCRRDMAGVAPRTRA